MLIPHFVTRDPERRARCAGTTVHHSRPHRQQEQARALCWQCPLQAECREWSIVTEQEHGVWGLLTFQQRLPLINARRARLGLPEWTRRVEEDPLVAVLTAPVRPVLVEIQEEPLDDWWADWEAAA